MTILDHNILKSIIWMQGILFKIFWNSEIYLMFWIGGKILQKLSSLHWYLLMRGRSQVSAKVWLCWIYWFKICSWIKIKKKLREIRMKSIQKFKMMMMKKMNILKIWKIVTTMQTKIQILKTLFLNLIK